MKRQILTGVFYVAVVLGYFLVMAPSALYVQDPDNAPPEFASETERILKVFADQLGNVSKSDPLDPATAEALLKLSEVPLLRERLIDFIQTERVRSQLREAGTRVRNAVQALRFYYEKQLAGRGDSGIEIVFFEHGGGITLQDCSLDPPGCFLHCQSCQLRLTPSRPKAL